MDRRAWVWRRVSGDSTNASRSPLRTGLPLSTRISRMKPPSLEYSVVAATGLASPSKVRAVPWSRPPTIAVRTQGPAARMACRCLVSPARLCSWVDLRITTAATTSTARAMPATRKRERAAGWFMFRILAVQSGTAGPGGGRWAA